MMNNDNYDIAFNNFDEMPYLPYRILEVLMTDESQEAENLWKCLKYVDVDCLDKPNLTLKEKRDMIWSGDWKGSNDSLEQNFSVFLKPYIGSAMEDAISQTQLRLFRYITLPTTQYESVICFETDFITNEKTSMIRNNGMLCEKTDYMESLYLNIFNGRDIKVGSGYLTFDKEFTRSCSSQLDISNSKNYYGRSLMMGLRYSNLQVGGDCG